MKDHDEQLSSYPNVVGFGVGYKVKGGKKLDQLAIIVFVKKKLPLSHLQRYEVIPANIREVLTDVQESGEIFAYQARTDKWRPAPPGVSIGHYLITAGTFGCVALKSAVRKILSNNHVLANSNSAFVGDAIYQQGVYDGGGPGDTIALLEDWVPIVFSDTANNLVDAAIAAPINDDDILNEILDIGVPIDVVEAELDMSVVKSGRTTAVTYGTITAINATITINYGAPGLARFIDQIIMTYMLAGGDSGSLLLTNPEHEAIGLCFAGSPALSVASRIQYAESLLGITIRIDITDASADLPAQFTVARGQEDLYAKFDVGQGSAELFASFDGQITQNLPAEFVIRQGDSQALFAEFESGQGSAELFGKFIVKQGFEDLLGTFEVTLTARLVASLASIATISTLESEVLIPSLTSVYSFPKPFVELLAGFWVKQGSQDLLGKYIIRRGATAELLGEFSAQAIASLPAKFEVGQGSQDLLGEFDIRREGSGDLPGTFDGQVLVELLAGFMVRQIASADFPGEFNIRHETSVDFPAAFDGQVSVRLAAEFISTQPGFAELPSKFSVRHIGTIDLPGSFDGQASADLPSELVVRQSASRELNAGFRSQLAFTLSAEFIARHTNFEEFPAGFEAGQGWENLPAGLAVGQASIDLLGKFNVRLVVTPYPLWTNRRWVNGVIELSESDISDAFLEEIIVGVMNDAKTWLIANEVGQYSSWTDISKTPMAIRRATTYGVVASLYARNIFSARGRFVIKAAPVNVKVLTTNEAAMEYWEGMMIRVLEFYLSAQDLDRIWVDTIDEDPVFSMEDIPPYTWNPDDYTTTR